MRLFDFFFPERHSSASVAKERLKIVLAHERASRDAPDFLPALQKELLDVVARYVEINSDMIRVSVDKTGETSTLEINVEIAGAKPRPVPPAEAKPPSRPAFTPPLVKPPSAEDAEAGWPFSRAPTPVSASNKRGRPA
jgi:cell division topological specificity factor